MCGRFCIAASPGEMTERYGVEVPQEYKPGYNVAPGQPILTITKFPACEAHMTEWGFQSGTMHRIINARVETIHEKPLFRNLFLHHRCLIPASGYYEWRHDGNRKVPYYFSSESKDLLSFAGLIRPSSTGDQVVILTTRASPLFSEIHERMPVILSSADDLKFLSEGEISIHNTLQMHEVSSRVNQVKFDDPDLVKPVKQIQEQKILADIL
jgi:putative SOS response-associated peptidase YedK